MTNLEWLETQHTCDEDILEFLLQLCLKQDDKCRCDKCEFYHDDRSCDAYIRGADHLAKWLFQEHE